MGTGRGVFNNVVGVEAGRKAEAEAEAEAGAAGAARAARRRRRRRSKQEEGGRNNCRPQQTPPGFAQIHADIQFKGITDGKRGPDEGVDNKTNLKLVQSAPRARRVG